MAKRSYSLILCLFASLLLLATEVKTYTIFRATEGTDHYANGVVMTAFKGKLYCMWQSSPKDEDTDDTWVAYSISSDDGKTWSKPMKLAVPTTTDYCTSGGWLVRGGTLTAYIDLWKKGLTPRGGRTYYMTSTDGNTWSQLQPVRMADGSTMQGVLEQDPYTLKDGRLVGAAHFMPGLHICPVYTDDANGVSGWRKANFEAEDKGKTSREIEPSQFIRPDGTLVMLFRDQSSSFRKLASYSNDRGETWTKPALTDYLDGRTKQCAGNLPDGTAFMVSCPSGSKERWPLVLQLSKDGKTFDETITLRTKEELPPRRYEGRYKTLGYSYPKAFVWHNKLVIGYSVNKEDVACTIVEMTVQAQYRSKVWCPDNGNGTYTNPVINADYSDPDVCVGPSGDDYYLTASSFHCTPGLPILHSKDLVNWQIVGYALKNLYTGNEALLRHFSSKPQHGNGVWAPSIRYHNGQYYIYWGDPDFGVMMVKTKNGNPAGEWEDPICVIEGQGYIDTTPLWDDDGRCYLVNGWANSRSKFASVLTVRELNSEGTKPIGEPVIVFDGNGTENRTCEGPKFYKRNGWYWIMCPAGGVPTGFQLAMRAKSPYGPYEHKIVLAQGKTNINGPHQGAWVHTKYGEDWFLHFQDKEAYGRVVHLNPVDWSSGWPIMGHKGEPVTTYRKPKASVNTIINPVESDEFEKPATGLQWQWHGNYDEKFGMATAFGTYRIYTYKLSAGWKNFWEVPNMLLQKTPADRFTVTTKLRFTSKAEGQMGGLIMMGLDYTALVVRRTGKQFELVQITCNGADKGAAQTEQLIATLKPTAIDKIDYKPGMHEDIYLRMIVNDSKLKLAWSQDGKHFKPCGSEFKMKEGKWIGAKFGFVSVETDAKADRGWLEPDWIRVGL